MAETRKIVPPDLSPPKPGERRRRGLVVHDDRGNARVEWVHEPPGGERTLLSICQADPGARSEHGYDPYASDARATRGTDGRKRRVRRDLRKLSEWIEQVRRAEALKRAARSEEDPQA